MTRIAFIGGGNMARSLIGGMLKTGMVPSAITVAEPSAETRESLGRELGVATYAEPGPAVAEAEVIVLAVKPQVLPSLTTGLRDALQRQRPMLISVAAGVRLHQLERWFGSSLAIIRCMPNVAALIGAGATGVCANGRVIPAQRALAQHILGTVGLACWVDDENLMDTVTALSGSGPAYFFALAEHMVAAAIAQGLPAATARMLAAQTCLGAGRMLSESGEDPALLRARVTSPNGTTQAALDSLANGGLPGIVADAMAAARRRGRELSDQLDQDA
ncbi:MAG TPA: pyrroline-5-carboxylate reductase [Rhodanobacter sp.]|jgi:pyrroline-5-carboxylate reductase|nr:pyrroline-5-carboxylate reductase [Rhodanobacter sp.]